MDENQSLLDLELNQEASSIIVESTKWGKYLGILILSGLGFLVLMFFLFWSTIAQQLVTQEESQQMNSGLLFGIFAGVIIIALAICGILYGFLIRGANRIRKGIENGDQALFNSGLGNIKNYFAMYGVLAILGILFAIIGLLNS